jgi:hypothetical protein
MAVRFIHSPFALCANESANPYPSIAANRVSHTHLRVGIRVGFGVT